MDGIDGTMCVCEMDEWIWVGGLNPWKGWMVG